MLAVRFDEDNLDVSLHTREAFRLASKLIDGCCRSLSRYLNRDSCFIWCFSCLGLSKCYLIVLIHGYSFCCANNARLFSVSGSW
jgi:hypothetical protein